MPQTQLARQPFEPIKGNKLFVERRVMIREMWVEGSLFRIRSYKIYARSSSLTSLVSMCCVDRQRIIANRIPYECRHRYKRHHIVSQSRVLDSILYRRATSMVDYANRDMIVQRVLKTASYLQGRGHPSLFVRFDTEWEKTFLGWLRCYATLWNENIGTQAFFIQVERYWAS